MAILWIECGAVLLQAVLTPVTFWGVSSYSGAVRMTRDGLWYFRGVPFDGSVGWLFRLLQETAYGR